MFYSHIILSGKLDDEMKKKIGRNVMQFFLSRKNRAASGFVIAAPYCSGTKSKSTATEIT